METQVCKRCQKKLLLTEFYVTASMRNGRDSHCKVCRKELRREYKQRDPEKHQQDVRRRRYLRRYDITVDDYDQMLKEQDGKCAICGTTKPHSREDVKYFAVDHDHATDKVRGLLCDRCNRGLGFFLDDSSLLKKATLYLSTN